jgi:uncharacterized membrane protein
MSHWTAIIFEDMNQAGEVRKSLKDLEKRGLIRVDDSAVIIRDEEGKVHVKGQADTGTKWGAFGGALIGAFLFLIFPVAGIVGGAVVGGLLGKMAGLSIDKQFVKDVEQAMQPGSSGIILVTSGGVEDAVRGAIEPHKGKLFSTSLDSETEKQLKKALE